MTSIPSIVPLLTPAAPPLQVGAIAPIAPAAFAAAAEAELPLPQSAPLPAFASSGGEAAHPDGAAMRPDQVFMSRQLSFPQDGRVLAGAWRSMVRNYGATLIDRSQRTDRLPPAALVLAQDGRIAGRAPDLLPLDAWRFTVHAGSAHAQHLQVLRRPADGAPGRRRRPRAALRLELELADGTKVALQVEPIPGGVAIEMAAPGAAALQRMRAIRPALEAAVERAGLAVVRWSFVDVVLPPTPAHAVLAADDAAQVLTLQVFRAVAEMALVLPAQG